MDLTRQKIAEKCEGCEMVRILLDHPVCMVYLVPEAKWRFQGCPMATHITKTVGSTERKKLNPLKASKRKLARTVT